MRGRAVVLTLFLAASARGDVDVRALAAAAVGSASGASPPASSPLGADLPVLIELPEGEDPRAYGLPTIGRHFSAVKRPLGELSALAAAHPAWRVTWSPPLDLLLDKATVWSRVPGFRNRTGFTGKGVVVGVVDAGIDARHPDFLNPDGTTRIAYFVDFSREPTGQHPDEEGQCKDAKVQCAVLSGTEIDALIAGGDETQIPVDPEGHGTHVASLAAGNGSNPKYVGMAPDASLIVAVVEDKSGNIDSAIVPLAVQLVFGLADKLGQARGLDRMPAVVNLSIGQDYGNHDGQSAIERSLSELVVDHPGRAIVAAAGNSAGQSLANLGYPTPLGIHTEVNIPERSSTRVPMVMAPRQSDAAGAMFVWISFRAGDEVSVGVDDNDSEVLAPLPPGGGQQIDDQQASITVVNGVGGSGFAADEANAASIEVKGTWPASKTFAVRLEGHGTASLWIETGGALGSRAVFFPAATRESTVASPAGSPSIIAVGATLNRTEWVDRAGKTIRVPSFGGIRNPAEDSVAYFSGAGPTSDLRMKPDIVAPGAFVIGAMSAEADPKTNKDSEFAEPSCQDPGTDCSTVIDDEHGVLAGTSMSSPIVTGAAALLFEQKPDRTADEVRTLLQAGARFPTGLVRLDAQLGVGALDLEGVLDVESAIDTPVNREPARGQSWMSLASGYAHPDPGWRVPGVLELRDESGQVADGFDSSALTLTVSPGTVTEKLTRVAPGFYRFAVAPTDGTGGDALHVSAVYRSKVLLEKDIPIAVDVNVAREGFAARGGCTTKAWVGGRTPSSAGALAFIAWLSRRRRRAARTARNPDRTDRRVQCRRGSSPK